MRPSLLCKERAALAPGIDAIAAQQSRREMTDDASDGEVEDDADWRARVRRLRPFLLDADLVPPPPQSAGRLIKLLRELDAAPRQGSRAARRLCE